MISEGSRATEVWSKFSFTITEINYILNILYNCYNIPQYYCFYCIFDRINAAEETSFKSIKNTFEQ